MNQSGCGRSIKRAAACVMLILATSGTAVYASSFAADDKTVGGVIAADTAWGAAEARGDAEYLDWLLMPGYVSVGSDGTVHSRGSIISRAQKPSTDAPRGLASKIEAWRQSHPYRTTAVIQNDIAVVSFVSTKAGSEGKIDSSDVFVFTGGNWHPIYSQHSASEL